MDAGDRRGTQLRHALAGLQAGIVGALAMVVWLAVAAASSRRSFWMIPNLYATTFYGARVYVNQYTRGSLSGLAVMLVICGVAGMVWGVTWRDQQRPFMGLFGALSGLVVYYILFDVILHYTSPLVPLYAPERQVQFGYLLWGIALARSPIYSRRIARTMGVYPVEAEEIRSGEVIR